MCSIKSPPWHEQDLTDLPGIDHVIEKPIFIQTLKSYLSATFGGEYPA